MIITLLSVDIIWENKEENLQRYTRLLESLDYKSDIIVFPEMFSTGFTMNSAMQESMDGISVNWLLTESAKNDTALIASIPIDSYNRELFVTPNGILAYYDKRHLFRMGNEPVYYKAGDKRAIVNYKNVNFALNICYDLRFPVWSRNIGNEYDVLINIANFPVSRIKAAEILAKARAIENLSYMIFVNRIGEDCNGKYAQSSMAINYKGENIGETVINAKAEVIMPGLQIVRVEIDIDSLRQFREKFPAWKDADDFKIF